MFDFVQGRFYTISFCQAHLCVLKFSNPDGIPQGLALGSSKLQHGRFLMTLCQNTDGISLNHD